MANTTYSNFFLSNEVEDQYNSHLDLQQFCKIGRASCRERVFRAV